MPRVLFVFLPGFPRKSNPVYTHSLRICREIGRAEEHVSVLTNASTTEEPGIEHTDGLRVRRIRYGLERKRRKGARLGTYIGHLLLPLLEEVRRVDLVYVRDHLLSLLLVCAALRRPIIVEKDDIQERLPEDYRSPRQRLVARLQFLSLRWATVVITQTQEARIALSKKGLPSRRIVVVPNGVDAADFRVPRAPSETKPRFVVVAHLDENKSFRETFRLAELMPDSEITIVGWGPRGDELQEESRRRGLANVRFFGEIDHDRLPPILASADFGIAEYNLVAGDLARHGFYYFPLKVLEYCASGLVVFVNACNSALTPFLEAGVVLRFGRAEDIVREARALIALPSRYQDLSTQAQSLSEAYDWSRVGTALLNELRNRSVVRHGI